MKCRSSSPLILQPLEFPVLPRSLLSSVLREQKTSHLGSLYIELLSKVHFCENGSKNELTFSTSNPHIQCYCTTTTDTNPLMVGSEHINNRPPPLNSFLSPLLHLLLLPLFYPLSFIIHNSNFRTIRTIQEHPSTAILLPQNQKIPLLETRAHHLQHKIQHQIAGLDLLPSLLLLLLLLLVLRLLTALVWPQSPV